MRRLELFVPLGDAARGPPPLAIALAERTTRAVLVERMGGTEARGEADALVRCTACAHRCLLGDGRMGACGVRFNRAGEVRAPFGYVARRNVRAVETNTVFHVRPGARALTFGMFGCDLRCGYCQNWRVSQALRDGVADEAPLDITADALVDEAIAAGAEVVCAAYNEPMISAEWNAAVFGRAKRRGLVTALISDGNSTPEALAFMRPVTDVFRVDLKGYDDVQYHALGGRFAPVLESIREAKRLGYWVEVVTLVVPGFNDDPAGLYRLARAISSIDPAIPWHLNAFRPRYRLEHLPAMTADVLVSAAGAAYASGMPFVYVGNVPEEGNELAHTRCPSCHEVVVARRDYSAVRVAMRAGGCGACGGRVPGIWG